jgi:hypothetical protein
VFDYFLSVDPGLRGCGCAVFGGVTAGDKNKTLLRAFYVKNTVKKERGAPAWAAMAHEVLMWAGREMPVVIETMRLRPGREKGNPNDILEVQGVAGAIASLVSGEPNNVVGYLPEQWKGTVQADVMTKRIESRLSADEWVTYDGGNHNVIDAIGIGLHHIGRLKAERIVIR